MQEQWKEQITQLQKMIDDSDRIVFFGGAGVSTGEYTFRIFGVQMDCIIRIISIHRSRL